MQLEKQVASQRDLASDAFSFANSDQHNVLITRGIERLISSQALSPSAARNLLRDLICNDTYGKFSELAAYDWITRKDIKITAQESLTTTEVLGDQGTIIDGRMDFLNIYFEIKAFGFHGFLARRLRERLEQELHGCTVVIEDSWDISIESFNALIADTKKVAQQLQEKRSFRFGRMGIRIVPPKHVMVSSRTVQLYLLAKENAEFPFKSANQFTRNYPFLLIYVLHPWLNQLSIHDDFAGADSTFTRAFARRAFMQFTQNTQPVSEVCKEISSPTTFAEAAKLLAGIMFLNVWPADAYPADRPESRLVPSWIYLNPRATHKIKHSTMRVFGHQVEIDDFSDDDY